MEGMRTWTDSKGVWGWDWGGAHKCKVRERGGGWDMRAAETASEQAASPRHGHVRCRLGCRQACRRNIDLAGPPGGDGQAPSCMPP